MKYFLIILLNILSSALSYKICVAGASSGLGREIIQQGLDRKNEIVGYQIKNKYTILIEEKV